MLTKPAYFATGFGDIALHSVASLTGDIHSAILYVSPTYMAIHIHLREKQTPSKITMETDPYREIVSKGSPFWSFCLKLSPSCIQLSLTLN